LGAAHTGGTGFRLAPAPPAQKAPQDGSSKPLQNMRDANHCGVLLSSARGEHSQTHKRLRAGDSRREIRSQWKSYCLKIAKRYNFIRSPRTNEIYSFMNKDICTSWCCNRVFLKILVVKVEFKRNHEGLGFQSAPRNHFPVPPGDLLER
jgi:hypothetical protein